MTGRRKPVAKGKPQPRGPPLAGGAALDGSLVNMHHSLCKGKVNLGSRTDVAVLDDSSPPSEKRLRVEPGGG